MKKIAVRFNGRDPTKGGYDLLPVEVVDFISSDQFPPGETWVVMNKPSLQEYIDRYRMKQERLLLVPNCGDIGIMPSQIIAGLSPENLAIAKNSMKRVFGEMLKAKIIDMLGGRNVSLNKSGAFVISMSSTLNNIGALMSGGALKTAMSALQSIKPYFPEHVDIIDYAISSMVAFLSSIDDL